MKYKTLFRLMLKGIGVWIFVTGVGTLASYGAYLVSMFFGTINTQSSYIVMQLFSPLVHMVAGLYLFFGGKWIADIAIPSNRPYCHECGYELTGSIGHLCTECGTPFRAPVIDQTAERFLPIRCPQCSTLVSGADDSCANCAWKRPSSSRQEMI